MKFFLSTAVKDVSHIAYGAEANGAPPRPRGIHSYSASLRKKAGSRAACDIAGVWWQV